MDWIIYGGSVYNDSGIAVAVFQGEMHVLGIYQSSAQNPAIFNGNGSTATYSVTAPSPDVKDIFLADISDNGNITGLENARNADRRLRLRNFAKGEE